MRIWIPEPSMIRNLAVILLVGVWGSLSATPTSPPRLCVENIECVESDGLDTGRTYMLADALFGVPFAVNTPTPPTITSEVAVTPATISANKVNGRRLILSAGEYGDQSFNTQDQEIVFTPGANFGRLRIGTAARRLAFRADPVRSGSVGYITTEQWQPPGSRPTDLLFDGINQVHIPGGEFYLNNVFAVDRLAIISSYLEARNFTLSCFHYGCTDLIFANNNSIGGDRSLQYPNTNDEAGHRINPVTRFVFVDNRVVKGEGPKPVLRVHAGFQDNVPQDTDHVYIARNQFEGHGDWIRPSGTHGSEGGTPGVNVGRLINVWYENNVRYMPPGTNFAPLRFGVEGEQPEIVRLRNNVSYGGVGSWPGQLLPAWTVENNTMQPYISTPAWSFR